ncbi:hypothetical protein NZD89_09310 [Alicyclobacillus fastidiosus]|uniref:Uncharacterized protein n=1 Tax=Alicyclobacillus fastidiosus TaxID=392011 RepID=A0ABY6ZL76_9BACL|nr:hypothetical protein [Alicyclobacillus fastidiosus]WAH43555.1 hypothetical protein NZD89_09310 [Alicyclobacillus fastidiosus]GMA59731.1 hypothetical protein GCM10025859_01710 [Alicyclobacillus fastidiosus]
MIDDILDALIAALQADTNLPEPIATYHKVEGMVQGLDTTCSVWVPKVSYKGYTNDYDEATAPIHIGIGVNDMTNETGEARVRALAEEIRMLLTADNHTLGGLIDDSFLSDWEFATYNSSQTGVLHMGEAVWQVVYYAPRSRPVQPCPTMDEMDFDETILTDTETIGG